MLERPDYPPLQFAAFRIALGVYLTVYFLSIVPYAGELLSAEGLVPDVRLNLSQRPFPDVLVVATSTAAARVFSALAAGAALLLAIGLFRRPAAVVLWYAIGCVAHRNTMFPDPSTPFIGWLVLATALVPPGEPLTATNRTRAPAPGWRFPRLLFAAVWIVLGVSYSVSGLIKLNTPEWTDGHALALFFGNALHRDSIVWSAIVSLPASALAVGTWVGLGTELLAGPLALTRWTRPVAWAALAGLHLTVLATMRTSMLSLGALLPLLLAFDASWLRLLRRRPTAANREEPKAERARSDNRDGGKRRRRQRRDASRGDRARNR